MLNKCFFMGRLVRDPEMRQTQSGLAVASFTLAVDRDRKDQNGEKKADFIDCTAWRSTADFVSKYFAKGRMAVVVGSLQIKEWEAKEGGKRRSPEVVADNVYFADSKKDGGTSNTYNPAGAPVDVPFTDCTDGPEVFPF